MTKPISLGLVGLGTIARNQHLPSLAETPALELTAIASRNASLDGVLCFQDIHAMLEGSDIAAVSLCTPPQGRFEQAVATIEAGRHLMLEKPPGATVSEVQALARLAKAKGVTLFATWHSREAAAVEKAREILSDAVITSVKISWREDVRHWHPGQEWIWQPGGLGVFDPGINALSILTRIMPDPVHVHAAMLEVPSNKQAPIGAELEMRSAKGEPVHAVFDWRQTGPQTWDIEVETETGTITLRDGGATLHQGDTCLIAAQDEEYRRLYKRFGELIAAGQSEVDLAPMQLVADAFLLADKRDTDPFHD